MANKRISDLERADVMAATDMFIMQQTASGEAMRMDGSVIQTFAETKALNRTDARINELVRAGIRGYSITEIETVEEGGAGEYNTYRGKYYNTDVTPPQFIGYTNTFRTKNGTNGLNLPPIVVEDITVPVSAWEADTTYEDFPYKALLTDEAFLDLVATDIPNIVLHPTAAMEGIVAPVCSTYISGSTKGIYIYASEVPTDSITILTAYAIHTEN